MLKISSCKKNCTTKLTIFYKIEIWPKTSRYRYNYITKRLTVSLSCVLFPGFHEAVGDTIALSVSSPKHLRRVGLISGDAEDEQTEINQLYKMVSNFYTIMLIFYHSWFVSFKAVILFWSVVTTFGRNYYKNQ